MSIKDNDPGYYADNEDGSEPHGYWLKSATFDRDRKREIELKRAVNERRACYLSDKPGVTPF